MHFKIKYVTVIRVEHESKYLQALLKHTLEIHLCVSDPAALQWLQRAGISSSFPGDTEVSHSGTVENQKQN